MQSTAALVQAMVLGKASLITPEDQFLFARLGLSHALSASGFHMVSAALFVTGGVRLILRLALLVKPGHNPYAVFGMEKAALLLSLAFMAFLAHACGWQKPMVRAFILALLWCVAKFFSIHPSKTWILTWSLLCAWFWGNGSWLSFTLSALSTVSLFWVAKYCSERVFSKTKKALFLTMAPFLVTLPLVLFYFALLPLVSPVANLLFCPLLSFGVLFPAFAHFLESLIFGSDYLLQLSIVNMGMLRQAMVGFAELFPYSYWVNWRHCLMLFFLLLPFTLFLKAHWKTGAVLAISISFILGRAYFPDKNSIILDVGQGDAILLRNGKELPFLIDTGPLHRSPYPARAATALEKEGISDLSGILITHPDADHYGGLASILLRHKVKTLWVSRNTLDFPKSSKFLSLAKTNGTEIRVLEESGAYENLRCKWKAEARNSNDLSPLCRFELPSGKTLLLTGDMDQATEDFFRRKTPQFLRADFLKVSHHGSKSSSGEDFLRSTRASIALVSAGRKNRYRHPARETLKRLQNAGMEIRRTDEIGALFIN